MLPSHGQQQLTMERPCRELQRAVQGQGIARRSDVLSPCRCTSNLLTGVRTDLVRGLQVSSCLCWSPLTVPSPVHPEFSSELWKTPLVKAKHNPSWGKKKMGLVFLAEGKALLCFPPAFSVYNLRISRFCKSNESVCFNIELLFLNQSPK